MRLRLLVCGIITVLISTAGLCKGQSGDRSDTVDLTVAQVQYINGKTGRPALSVEFRPADHLLVRGADDTVKQRVRLHPDTAAMLRSMTERTAILNESVPACDQPARPDGSYRIVRFVTEYKTVAYKLKSPCDPPPSLRAFIHTIESIRRIDSPVVARYRR